MLAQVGKEEKVHGSSLNLLMSNTLEYKML